MTDKTNVKNIHVKAGHAPHDGSMATRTGKSDAKVATHTLQSDVTASLSQLSHAGEESHKISASEKSGSHKTVPSEAKTPSHAIHKSASAKGQHAPGHAKTH